MEKMYILGGLLKILVPGMITIYKYNLSTPSLALVMWEVDAKW